MSVFRRSFLSFVGAGVLAAAGFLASAQAAELLLVERQGCPWCRRAEAEITSIYPKTEEGRLAPLRRIDLSGGLPANITFKAPVRFTPTFVLVDRDHEIGRITGYLSDESFWGLLAELTKTLPPH